MEVPFAKLGVLPKVGGFPQEAIQVPLEPSPKPGWIGKILALEMVTHPGWEATGGNMVKVCGAHAGNSPSPTPHLGPDLGMGKEAVPGKIP